MGDYNSVADITYKIKGKTIEILVRLLKRLSSLLNEEIFLKIMFKLKIGESLDLQHPKTFNEKLQWLKLNYRSPEQTMMVDRYEAKKYVSGIIGKKHVITTLGIWEKFDNIDFDELPNQFVLKTTHDSGGVVVIKDKKSMRKDVVKRKISKHLKINYYYYCLEWPYKNVKPRIIAEEYMTDGTTGELNDYKFLCFNGKPHLLFINIKDDKGVRRNFYDINFNRLNITQNHKQNGKEVGIPKNLNKMIEYCKMLSGEIPHIRIDFYDINGNIYFGEFTFFHDSGFIPFYPKKWNYKLGEYIQLPIET